MNTETDAQRADRLELALLRLQSRRCDGCAHGRPSDSEITRGLIVCSRWSCCCQRDHACNAFKPREETAS